MRVVISASRIIVFPFVNSNPQFLTISKRIFLDFFEFTHKNTKRNRDDIRNMIAAEGDYLF